MEIRLFKHRWENSGYREDCLFYYISNVGRLIYLKKVNDNFEWSYLLESCVDHSYLSYDDMLVLSESSLRLDIIYQIELNSNSFGKKRSICLASGCTHVDIEGSIWHDRDIKSIDYTLSNFKIIEEIN